MSAEEYERSGDGYFNSGNLQQAFLQYDKSLRLAPGKPQLSYKIGLLFLLNKMNGDAIQQFQEVIKKEPQNALAYEGMGLALFQQQKTADAERYFFKAIELNQTLWKSYNCLGIIYDKQKDYKRAIDFYEKAIVLKPDNQLLYNNLGLSYLLAGNYDRAIKSFDKAMGFRSVPNKVYNNMGLALGLAGRYQEALETFKKVSDEASAYNNMGCVLLMKGEYQKASQAFETAIKLKPSFYTIANENLKKAKTGSGSSSNMDFLADKQQQEIAKAEDFKLEKMPPPKQQSPKQAEKSAPATKDVPKVKVQSIDEETTERIASQETKLTAGKPEVSQQVKKSETVVTANNTQPAKETVPNAATTVQVGADKIVVAQKEIAKQGQNAAPNPPVENKTENNPAAETTLAKDVKQPPVPQSPPPAQQGAESKAASPLAESKEAANSPVAAVPLVAAAKEVVQAVVPAAQKKPAEQTAAKTEPVLTLEGTTAQAPAAEKLDNTLDKKVQGTMPETAALPGITDKVVEATHDVKKEAEGSVANSAVTNKTTEESAALIKEEPPSAAPPVVSGAPGFKPEEKQEAAVSKEIPPVANNISGTEPAAIQKTELQGQVAQPITSPDNPPIAAPETISGAVGAEAAKTEALKAGESVGTEKKADIEPASSGEEAMPAKDAVQIAETAAPTGVVRDVTAPIEAKPQAEIDKASAGTEKKDIEVPAAAKEVTLEKTSTPAVEPEEKKEAEKKAAIKIDAGTESKKPELQTVKKSQRIIKNAAKVSQKEVEPAASKYHVIAKGDTLTSLSRRYNTDPDKLRKLNGMYDESILKIGAKIRIN
jgi:tetratricopeptide (TPR) repeat protein